MVSMESKLYYLVSMLSSSSVVSKNAAAADRTLTLTCGSKQLFLGVRRNWDSSIFHFNYNVSRVPTWSLYRHSRSEKERM